MKWNEKYRAVVLRIAHSYSMHRTKEKIYTTTIIKSSHQRQKHIVHIVMIYRYFIFHVHHIYDGMKILWVHISFLMFNGIPSTLVDVIDLFLGKCLKFP